MQVFTSQQAILSGTRKLQLLLHQEMMNRALGKEIKRHIKDPARGSLTNKLPKSTQTLMANTSIRDYESQPPTKLWCWHKMAT
ncbi:hypothetical protein GQ55_2G179300 [Panicum hallii var. hallii]|uniref:Uncharacterized protein n=1 Tax=Panicum hallii var. hallii TaxID=1504633 RepID=A0A2T7EQ91_9POAL|nr:hypothetical protein GQ55_2G179300 [Panicum hallii var. hallii]